MISLNTPGSPRTVGATLYIADMGNKVVRQVELDRP
jgi:hypothetical protein